MRGLFAGKLTKLFVVERRVPNDAGDTWSSQGRFWGELISVTGDERWRSGETEADVTHLVRGRYFPLKPTDRLLLTEPSGANTGTRTFDVKNVASPGENRSKLEATVIEVIA